MSRLTIDLSDQQHKCLKAVAAMQGKTIKQYVIERLFEPDCDEDQAWEEFKAFIGKRVDSGLAGAISPRTFDEIVEAEFAIESPQ